jgi:hypothetical protein
VGNWDNSEKIVTIANDEGREWERQAEPVTHLAGEEFEEVMGDSGGARLPEQEDKRVEVNNSAVTLPHQAISVDFVSSTVNPLETLGEVASKHDRGSLLETGGHGQ